ncbi:hypothetical protein V1505DRAFT_371656 [Lipomyces doorenjongii]
MVLETYELVKQRNAEDVFIVGNPSATREVVYGMRSRGIFLRMTSVNDNSRLWV